MNRLLTIYRRLKTNKLADTLIMVISDAGKAIIKHCHDIGHTVCKIWKDNPEKHWDKTSMKRLIKRFEAFVTMRKAKRFSGLPRTATTENEEDVEEMICSQEDHPDTHVPQKILPRD